MATNRDLLKEAIADAKAVKEMAIANAKTALEEAFTPRLKEMLSAKIQEMDKEDDDVKEMMYDEDDDSKKMEEEMKYEEDDSKMEEAMEYEEDDSKMEEAMYDEDDSVDEMNLEELLAELEEEEKEEKVEETLNEAEDEEESEMDDEKSEDEEGEPLDLEDMTDEDLKKMIEDVIADMIDSGELEAGEGAEEEGEEMEMSDEEEDVDLTELLKEIEEEMKDDKKEVKEIDDSSKDEKIEKEFASLKESESLTEEPLPSGPELAMILSGIAAIIGSGIGLSYLQGYIARKAKEGSEKFKKIKATMDGLGSAAGGATRSFQSKGKLDEEMSDEATGKKIDDILKLDEVDGIEESESLNEEPFTAATVVTMITGLASVFGAAISFNALKTHLQRKAKEGSKRAATYLKFISMKGSRDLPGMSEEKEVAELQAENESLKTELSEAVKTTNATNLLNAKLLYTNKIFKSKNLNESQKVKVLSSFDKANTVKESKLIYETLNEGLKVKKSNIKENLGRASKATTVPTTKKPIVESNDVFARMQKLAGIK